MTDLIQSLQIVLQLATEPGDGVVAHLPNYPPFPNVIAQMHRELRAVQLRPDGDTWRWRDEEFEAAAQQAKVLLLVNPHNPTGRVFTRGELQFIAELAERHDLLVLCDEVHAELAHDPHEHIPFATIAPERTVTITSATKAYNIAGVRTAAAHVGPAWLRERWDATPPTFYGVPNALGLEATIAAWRDSDDWLAHLRQHLREQRAHLTERINALPGLRMLAPDAGYLAWIDCTEAGLSRDPFEHFREHAGLFLSHGPDYDPAATTWVRLNFATSRAILDEIVDRMASALS